MNTEAQLAAAEKVALREPEYQDDPEDCDHEYYCYAVARDGTRFEKCAKCGEEK